MSKFLLTILILLCCAFYLYPQQNKSNPVKKKKYNISSEKKVKPILSGKSIVQVKGLTAVAGGKDGKIFVGGYNTEFEKNKVNGYGLLWKISGDEVTVKKLPFLDRTSEIFFIDNFTGWVSGAGGIYKTTDGGETWKKTEYSDDARGGKFFLDGSTGWYFGKDEYLKRAANSVVKKLKLFENFPNIKKLQFTSLKSGWLQDVIDSQVRFLHTEDGGKTWDAVSIDNDSGVDDFQFLSDDEGFAIAAEGLYNTNDGGKTWNLVKKQIEDNQFFKLFFLDGNTGWAIGRNTGYFTNNGGLSWKCSEFQEEIGNSYIKEFIFTDVINGWLLTEEGLYFTVDGGEIWQRKQLSFGKQNF